MTPLARLAQAHGIALRYHDIFGHEHEASESTLRALLAGMGVHTVDDAQIDGILDALDVARWNARLAPLVVRRADERPWTLRAHLPASVDAGSLSLRVRREDGGTERAAIEHAAIAEMRTVEDERWQAIDLAFSADLPLGYHAIELTAGESAIARSVMALAPRACYRPPALKPGHRAWGVALQLYGLRSQRNWGIGDFTDLRDAIEGWAREGAAVVGLNPLHALFPHNPFHVSPYSPSSRLFVNPMYLDVEAIDDFRESAEARALVGSTEFSQRLATLRASEQVDYPGVAAAKREVLDALYASFRRNHVARSTARAQAFERFKAEAGEALARHTLFEALQARLHAADASIWGWPAWPETYRDPASPDVRTFARDHAAEVDFYAYLQWQADLQRAAAADAAKRAGMALGVYADLAVSIDRGGAESWANQTLYAVSSSVGAPPDAFNPAGQDWGLPPLVPSRLEASGFAPFIATLRANMRHAGALRIDHVMGLMRLFWVPPGRKPAEGAYVAYPLEDLVSLLALESHRHRCLVIGEDLGTVPDEVRHALAGADVLSYRVLLFERDASGEFKPPSTYPEAAIATGSTHDLPTLAGWWEGHDIDTRRSLGLVDSSEEAARQHAERREDRARLLRALEREGLLPDGVGTNPDDAPVLTAALAEAVAAFLARTPSVLDIVQFEDALRVREQANLPGTLYEHPNWRRKLPVTLPEAFADGGLRALAARLREERG